jgi:Tol biopolymer transport system component
LQRIITKALRKDREERYQKVEAMLLDLKSLKHELELKARPENSTQSALNSGETHVAQQDTETKGSLSFGSQQVSASTATAHEERSRAGWWSTHPLWLTAVLAVVLVSATSFYFVRHSHEAPLPPMKVTPFTSFEGQEFSPAFSPDGNQIAFAWGKSEKGGEITFDIYVKQIGSEKALQITSDPAWDMGPVWSPDGQKIAFARYSESDVAIFTISSLGGAERKLLSLGPRTTWVQLGSLSWSANGKFIAYSSKATAGQPLQIFLLAPDSLEKHTLTSPPDQSVGDDVPAFSPDSQTLAFTRTNNDATSADIYVLPVTGGEPRRLTFDNVNPRGLDWTADGREIVFSSNREGPREGPNSLWKISASGGLPERLAVGGDNVVYPSISRRGHRLAYAKGSTGDVNIYRIERSGSSNRWSPPTKFISSTQRDTNAQFSPDGKHIVFESSRAGNFGIWVCDNDGSNPVEVSSSDREWTGTPRWSPDGRQIAFDLKREHDWDIYTTGVDGGPPRRLTTESSDENVPSWSRDGRWIYFSSNRTGKRQVWKAPAEGGEAVQVTKEGGFLAFESPDGKFVYYTEDYEGQLTPGIWRIPTGGGEETRVLDSFNPVTWGDWAIVSDGIYFIDSDAKGYWAIRFFDFAKRSVTKIAPLDHEIFNNGLAVSPDRRQILYTRVDEIGGVDIWLVENFR